MKNIEFFVNEWEFGDNTGGMKDFFIKGKLSG
jgi:hypothetical protein